MAACCPGCYSKQFDYTDCRLDVNCFSYLSTLTLCSPSNSRTLLACITGVYLAEHERLALGNINACYAGYTLPIYQ